MFALGGPHLPFGVNPRGTASDASASVTGVPLGSRGCSRGLPIGRTRGNSDSLLGNASDRPPGVLGVPPAGSCVVPFLLSRSLSCELCSVQRDNGHYSR